MKKLRQEVRWYRLQAPFEAVHYPGHIGFPPNECADVTANMGRKAINLPQTIGQILASAGPTPPMPDPPQIIALSDALYWTRIQEAQDPIVSLHCTPTRKIKYDLTFTCATANVLSLKGGQEAVSQPTDTAFPHIQLSAARRLDLAQQFQSHSLTIIGLQETRGRAPKGWDVATYHTYAAPASSRGQGGLEIWITKSFLQGQEAVFVLHADHRRLLIKAYTVAGILYLFNAHALDSHTYQMDKVRLWWAETERILDQHVPPRFSSIWLLDANALVNFHQHLLATGNRINKTRKVLFSMIL